MKKITIVSPCFNEEENVRACYEAIRDLFNGPLVNNEREHILSYRSKLSLTHRNRGRTRKDEGAGAGHRPPCA